MPRLRDPVGYTLRGIVNGVGTNFGVGVGEARPEEPRAGDRVLGEGTAPCSLSHQIWFPGAL